MGFITFFYQQLTGKSPSYRSFVRFVKVGIEKITDAHIMDIYCDELAAAKVKRRLPLYINNQVISPMLVGIIRPTLIIPILEASDHELRNILRHELTHYKRLDFLYKWIVQITLCLHWFNPIAYLISKQIDKSCELSCDEAVIKNLDEDSRIIYGDALMASMKAQGNYSNFVVSMTMSENVNIVKERLDMIMSYKKKSKLIFVATFILTISLLCGFTFTGAYAANNANQNPNDYSSNFNPISDNNSKRDYSTERENISTPNTTMPQLEKAVPIQKDELFNLKDSFLGGAGELSSDSTFSLESAAIIRISANMTVDVGTLSFCIKSLSNDKVIYQYAGNATDNVATISLEAGEYQALISGKNIWRVDYEVSGDVLHENYTVSDSQSGNGISVSFSIYKPLGMTYNEREDNFYYEGKRIRSFSDKLDDTGMYNSFMRDNGEIDVRAIRNGANELVGLEKVTQ